MKKIILPLILTFVMVARAEAWHVPFEPIVMPTATEEPGESFVRELDPEKQVSQLEVKPHTTKKNISKMSGSNFQKMSAELSEEEQAIVDYSEALEAIRLGQDVKAQKILEGNIARFPIHSMSRAELAKLYLKQHRDLDAEVVLEEGLRLSEKHPEFLKLMAITYERRGELNKSMDYLSKIPLDQQNDCEVVAMWAHIYQNLGHYSKARSQYQRLIQFESNNPLWTLGLAMAYDSEGNKKSALEKYEQLQSAGGVDSKIMHYVQERIASLKN